jgi:hypothetical protein
MKHLLKNFAIWIATAVLFASCSASKQAHRYFDRNPHEFAGDCADAFPLRDSTAEKIGPVRQADNPNYQHAIDSVAQEVAHLKAQVQADTSLTAAGYRGQIGALEKIVKKLRDDYKPCKPDTLTVTREIYRENTARLVAESQRHAETTAYLEAAEKERDELKATVKAKDAELSDVKKERNRANTRFWLTIAAAGAFVIYRVLRAFKIF